MKWNYGLLMATLLLWNCKEEKIQETSVTEITRDNLVEDSLNILKQKLETYHVLINSNEKNFKQKSDSILAIYPNDEYLLRLTKLIKENKNLTALPQPVIADTKTNTAEKKTKDQSIDLSKIKTPEVPKPNTEGMKKVVSKTLFKSSNNSKIEYTGTTIDGKANGIGKGIFETGSIYEGEWKDNKRHGKGIFTWTDGSSYEGEYKEGKRNGKGKYTFVNGDVYEGNWKDDRRDGLGTYKNKNGKVLYNGIWEKDNFVRKQ